MAEPKPHLGWRSRGYLPHYDAAWLLQHIVFGLVDSVPKATRPPSTLHADRLLDAGHGACVLRNHECAAIVENALLHADSKRYRLIAWCVMPNHVHVLIEQLEGHPLGDVIQSWKSATAHKINGVVGREGRLWRREYFDRFMRDQGHLSSTIDYIEENPVRAKLVAEAEEWRFSSARLRLK